MKKAKKFILKDDGNNKYNSGEVITLLESITDSINLIAEQHGEIVKRLDKIEARLDKIEDDIREIKIILKNKADKNEFGRMEKRVVKLKD